jgi:hypothetical protein
MHGVLVPDVLRVTHHHGLLPRPVAVVASAVGRE